MGLVLAVLLAAAPAEDAPVFSNGGWHLLGIDATNVALIVYLQQSGDSLAPQLEPPVAVARSVGLAAAVLGSGFLLQRLRRPSVAAAWLAMWGGWAGEAIGLGGAYLFPEVTPTASRDLNGDLMPLFAAGGFSLGQALMLAPANSDRVTWGYALLLAGASLAVETLLLGLVLGLNGGIPGSFVTRGILVAAPLATLAVLRFAVPTWD